MTVEPTVLETRLPLGSYVYEQPEEHDVPLAVALDMRFSKSYVYVHTPSEIRFPRTS